MEFEGIVNARDLGGVRIGDRTVRPGRLLRTGHLHDATDADIARLSDSFHLKRIFDFRTMDEAAAQPSRPRPGWTCPRILSGWPSLRSSSRRPASCIRR